MKCLVCHHDMVERKITLDLRIGEDLVIIEEVPATVCENCGEQVFTPEVTRQVQAVAQERKARARTILVPVFSLGAQGKA
jgi:YgiT-type zinc finger domain-containing protein